MEEGAIARCIRVSEASSARHRLLELLRFARSPDALVACHVGYQPILSKNYLNLWRIGAKVLVEKGDCDASAAKANPQTLVLAERIDINRGAGLVADARELGVCPRSS